MLTDVQKADTKIREMMFVQANSLSQIDKELNESRPSITSLQNKKENEAYNTFSSIR